MYEALLSQNSDNRPKCTWTSVNDYVPYKKYKSRYEFEDLRMKTQKKNRKKVNSISGRTVVHTHV